MSPILVAALVLIFTAAVLAVYGGGEWVAGRLSTERGLYERVVGKELHRLFLEVSPQEFVIIHLGIIMGFIVLFYMIFGGMGSALAVGLPIGIVAPRFWLKRMWAKRIRMIDEQVEEAMVYMSNSFKANPSLPEAVQDVCNSMGPPISQEFSVVLREYKLGTPLDQALINMQRRINSRNMGLAVAALLVGRTVGGNIPKILEDIAATVRESYRLERVIDQQTAQGKMQAWVIGLAPAGICGVFYLMDPTLIRPLFNSFFGYIVLFIAVMLNVSGVAIMLKIIKIEV
jgi:tight adherence protein B